MNTGVWIFLTVVLLLLVLHPGFRRFATWVAGVCAVVAAVGTLVWWLHSRNQSAAIGRPLVAGGAPAVSACPPGSTKPGCPVPLEDQPDISDLPVPPCGTLGADPRTCAPQSAPPDDSKSKVVSTVPICPPGVNTTPGKCFAPLCDPPPAKPIPGCVLRSNMPWLEYPPLPPGYTLDCPQGQKPTKDNITGAVSCYNPRDPAQLKAHLAGCSHKGDPEWMKHDQIIADRRGIPCRV